VENNADWDPSFPQQFIRGCTVGRVVVVGYRPKCGLDALFGVALQLFEGVVVGGAGRLDVHDGETRVLHSLLDQLAQGPRLSGETGGDERHAQGQIEFQRSVWASILPNGVELVTTPSLVVGELWPLVRP